MNDPADRVILATCALLLAMVGVGFVLRVRFGR